MNRPSRPTFIVPSPYQGRSTLANALITAANSRSETLQVERGHDLADRAAPTQHGGPGKRRQAGDRSGLEGAEQLEGPDHGRAGCPGPAVSDLQRDPDRRHEDG